MDAIRVRRDALLARAAKAAAKTAAAEKKRVETQKRKDVEDDEAAALSDLSGSESEEDDDNATSETGVASELRQQGDSRDDELSLADETSTATRSPSIRRQTPRTTDNKSTRLYTPGVSVPSLGQRSDHNDKRKQDVKPRYVKRRRIMPPGECHSCGTSDTPEWRKGPDGPKTLCNSCGLQWAKLSKRTLVVKMGTGLRQVKVQ
jgi:hypothetical protein